MTFLLTNLEAGGSGFGEMLSDAEAGDRIGVVSAEKVFRKLIEEHKYPYDWLVDTNYQHAVKPVNPEGKTAVDKWGSSFETGGGNGFFPFQRLTWTIKVLAWLCYSKPEVLARGQGVCLRE